MLLEQVGAHNHADVSEGQKELVVLIKRGQGHGKVPIHDTDSHDGGWVHDGAVQTDGLGRVVCRISRHRTASTWSIGIATVRKSGTVVEIVKIGVQQCARLTVLDHVHAGKGAKCEHESLVPV